MKPEEQRIAIAQACGWKFHPLTEHLYSEDEKVAAIMCWVRPGNDSWHTECVPDYLNDLNAMRDAEKMMDAGMLAKYTTELLKACGGPMSVHFATAAQRAEAFLKTLDLWEESK